MTWGRGWVAGTDNRLGTPAVGVHLAIGHVCVCVCFGALWGCAWVIKHASMCVCLECAGLLALRPGLCFYGWLAGLVF